MPKRPILARTLMFARLRDKTIRLLDWNRVDTTVGTAWESRRILPQHGGSVPQTDVYDNSFTDINEVQDGAVFLGIHGGLQYPSDFNTQ